MPDAVSDGDVGLLPAAAAEAAGCKLVRVAIGRDDGVASGGGAGLLPAVATEAACWPLGRVGRGDGAASGGGAGLLPAVATEAAGWPLVRVGRDDGAASVPVLTAMLVLKYLGTRLPRVCSGLLPVRGESLISRPPPHASR